MPKLLAPLILLLAVAIPAAAANLPPAARAGPNLLVAAGTQVSLDGSASADQDGNPITYAWSQLTGPATVTLLGATTAIARFTTSTLGSYRFLLTVSDNQAAVSTSSADVTIQTAADGPDLVVRSVSFTPAATPTDHNFQATALIQNVGNRSSLTTFTTVFSLTTDARGAAGNLTFAGNGPSVGPLGPGATFTLSAPVLQVPFSLAPSSYFVAATLDNGSTVTELLETNNTGVSARQLVVPANTAPVAMAVVVGVQPFIITDKKNIICSLDGSGSSDFDRDPIAYTWVQSGGPSVFLSNPTSRIVTFATSQAPATYVFSLTVSDGHRGQNTASVALRTVSNTSPQISVVRSQLLTSTDGRPVQVFLDASQTLDLDSDPVTFQWFQTSVPPIALLNANTPTATFTTARTTFFSFGLITTDPRGGTSRADTSVQIVLNLSPTASAGASRVLTITDGKPIVVTLDGTRSSDPDGDRLAYSWSQISSPGVNLSPLTSPTPSFTSGTPAAHVFRLTVTDRRGGTSSQDVTFTLQRNSSPTARTGPPQTIAATGGTTLTVVLDGSGSTDPELDALSYTWTQSSGPPVTIFGAASARPNFAANAQGSYGFLLTVSDRRGGISTATASASVSFPDLRPTAATFPSTAGAGLNVSGTVSVANSSLVRLSSPFSVGVYLSRDNRFDAGDQQIAAVSFPGVDALGAASVPFTAGLSLPTPAGSYSVILQADPQRALVEPSRSDNVLVLPGTLKVLSPPDLTVVAMLASVTARVGTTLTVSGTVLNQGQQDLTVPFDAAVLLLTSAQATAFIATDQVPAGTVRLGSLAFGPLLSGQGASFATTVTIPQGVLTGAYFAGVLVDPDRRIALTLDRTNDSAVSPTPTLVGGLPDVRVKSLSAPLSVQPGVEFPISLEIENRGTEPVSKAFVYWYFLSKESSPVPTGIFLGAELRQPPIAAGTVVAAIDNRIPARSMPPGQYFLKAILDPLSQLEEEDRTNNSRVTAAPLTVLGTPELVISTVGFPTVLQVRDATPIVVSVQNIGNSTGSNFKLRATRSSDRVLDSTDTTLGVTTVVKTVAAGATVQVTVTASFADPGTAALGPAFLLVDLTAPPDVSPQTLEGPPGNLRVSAVTLFDTRRVPGCSLSYSRQSPLPSGPLTITAIFDESIVTIPTIRIDQAGSVDQAATPMAGSGTTFTFTYTVSRDNAGAFRDGVAIVSIDGARDRDQNLSLPAANNTFRIDTRPPVISSVSPADGSTSASSGTLKGRIADDSTFTLTFSVNGGPAAAVTPAPDGAFTATYTFSGAAADLQLTALDAAGNRTSSTVRVQLGTGTVVPPPPAGTPPIADAGLPKGQGPGLAVLDGTRSRDASGGSLAYAWTQTAGPAVTLTGASLANPQFAARSAGHYAFRLTVRNAAGLTSSSDTAVDVANMSPSADAGLESIGGPGRQIFLDGTRSSDPNGDSLTYAWSERSDNPRKGLLADATSSRPSFIPPVTGSYAFSLTVNDGSSPSTAPATVRVLAINPGGSFAAPDADAGPDQLVLVNDIVKLDGRESADPDSSLPLTYSWRSVSTPPRASPVVLSNAATARPAFQPGMSGIYVFELTVSDAGDDNLASDPARTAVVVNALGNHVPRALPGATRSGRVGEILMLDGSGSLDSDRNPLSYVWSQLSGPAVALPITSGAVIPVSFVVSGEYTFGLTVNDGVSNSPVESLLVRVSPDGQNRPPVAVARANGASSTSPEIRVRIPGAGGLTVLLDGSGSSDPDGNALSYRWRQVSGPPVDLTGASSAAASFSPLISRVYAFELEVGDGIFRDRAVVQVVVDSSSNSVPRVGFRGAPSGSVTTAAGGTIVLDGSLSSDPDGSQLLFTWVQTAGPFLDLVGQGTSTLLVTPRVNGSYAFRLFVDDGRDRSVGKEITVLAADPGTSSGGTTGGTTTGTKTPATAAAGSGGVACGMGGGQAAAADAWFLLVPLVWIGIRRRASATSKE